MDAEKLLKLADGLENYVKDEWWSYGVYFDRGFPLKECGSMACGIGWSVPIMDDPRLQFAAKESGYSDDKYYRLSLDGDTSFYNGNEEIMARYFDIPYDDACTIFNSPDDYGKKYYEVTRRDVAEMIRHYVAEHRESNPCYSED